MKQARGSVGTKRPFRKGDVVVCITGESKGKKGKVLAVYPAKGRALVEGLNLVKRHMRKSQDNPKGGIVQKEAPIHISNLRKEEGKTEKTARKNAEA